MMVDKVLFSSQSEEWQTPLDLYNKLNEEFDFTLDPCTTIDNPLNTPCFYTKETNGLIMNWFGSVFVNPPYNKEISKWIEKAIDEIKYNQCIDKIVFLLPVRTDTKWFHDYIYNDVFHTYRIWVRDIRFIRGRLKFIGGKNSAPFPSMIVVFGR